MTTKRTVISILLMLCTAITALSLSQQNEKRAGVKFPPGDWSFTHPVTSQLRIANSPVRIISNTGDATKGLTITNVGLRNDSGRTISAVKFRWYLFREDAPGKILKKGETPMIGLGDLAAGSERVLEYPVVRFANLYQPFVKDGKLTGKFAIEIAVNELQYADGSSWKRR